MRYRYLPNLYLTKRRSYRYKLYLLTDSKIIIRDPTGDKFAIQRIMSSINSSQTSISIIVRIHTRAERIV